MRAKLLPHSDEWVTILKKKVQVELQTMQREFSDDEFAKAIGKMDHMRLTLSGVTFLLYLV